MNELGEIRPTQLIFTFGVGSLIDLPNMSALVMGLDDWDTRYCKEIQEDRLVAAIQKRLGPQMARLYLPPIKLDGMEHDPGAPATGVPPRRFRDGCAVPCAILSPPFNRACSSWCRTRIVRTRRNMFT